MASIEIPESLLTVKAENLSRMIDGEWIEAWAVVAYCAGVEFTRRAYVHPDHRHTVVNDGTAYDEEDAKEKFGAWLAKRLTETMGLEA